MLTQVFRYFTGFCYSTRMTLHAPLAKTEPAGNPHPEQPSRIQGVFRKLGGKSQVFGESIILFYLFTFYILLFFFIFLLFIIEDFGLLNRMQRINIREAVKDEILLVHSETHWERVRRTGCKSFSILEFLCRILISFSIQFKMMLS